MSSPTSTRSPTSYMSTRTKSTPWRQLPSPFDHPIEVRGRLPVIEGAPAPVTGGDVPPVGSLQRPAVVRGETSRDKLDHPHLAIEGEQLVVGRRRRAVGAAQQLLGEQGSSGAAIPPLPLPREIPAQPGRCLSQLIVGQNLALTNDRDQAGFVIRLENVGSREGAELRGVLADHEQSRETLGTQTFSDELTHPELVTEDLQDRIPPPQASVHHLVVEGHPIPCRTTQGLSECLPHAPLQQEAAVRGKQPAMSDPLHQRIGQPALPARLLSLANHPPVPDGACDQPKRRPALSLDVHPPHYPFGFPLRSPQIG